MIISASRRTDIPAFYEEWFIRRIRAGFCDVINPFNSNQISRVSLLPEEVDAIVFWSRHPRPMFDYLDELNSRGFHYYFQYTILDYPRLIETSTPVLEIALNTFRELSRRLSPLQVIWRYDPVVFSEITPPAFHVERFHAIATALEGFTTRVFFSLMDFYPKLKKRLRNLENHGNPLISIASIPPGELAEMLHTFAIIARQHDMEIFTCSEQLDLSEFGIQRGSCIDAGLISSLFGNPVNARKDPFQRQACECAASKDIGAYNSCIFGCQYCYAVQSFEQSRRNYLSHDANETALVHHRKY